MLNSSFALLLSSSESRLSRSRGLIFTLRAIFFSSSSCSLVFVELLGDENAQLHARLFDQPVHPELFVDQPGEAGRQRLAKVHRKRTLGVEPVLTPNIDTRVSVVIVIAMFG